MNTTEWRALIHNLRKRFPVSGTVTVRRYPSKRLCGATTFDGRNYCIRVDSKQPRIGQIDTLLHEWAHVYAIEQAYTHGGPWASIFGEIYTAWTDNFEEKG